MTVMRQILCTSFVAAAAAVPAIGIAVEMPKEDTVKGAADHPLLSRYAGSKLVGFNVKQFDEVKLFAGKAVKNQAGKIEIEKVQTVQGKWSRVAYNYPADRSSFDVMRNYQDAIQKAGLTTVFSCDTAGCGPEFGDRMLERIDNNSLKMGSEYWSTFNYGSAAQRYLLATGSRSDGSIVHAAVYVTAPTDNKLGGVYLEIVEAKALETGKVSVNLKAEEMAKGLVTEGKIALYGIYFDTDKADVKPESKAQLEEMAKLLQSDPKLNVYVVGHTDNQGSLARNLTLSQQRAQAVAQALVTQHKIDAKRLSARGVASFSPVASNDADAGRAKNRRVELVKQ
jgi:OmpA-OmpF porin, OOP family